MSYRGQGSDAAAVVITSSRSRNRASKVSNTSIDSSRNGHSGKQQISAFQQQKQHSVPHVSAFKPTTMFQLPVENVDEEEEEDNNDVLNDDDIRKIHRLQLINASARFELLSANQQLIDFGLSRLMNSSKKLNNKEVGGKKHLNDLYNIDKSVIEEASETEENNTTNMKINRNLGALRTEDSI